MTVQKGEKTHSGLETIEAIFFRYIKDGRDEQAAVLVPAITEEASHDASIPRHKMSGEYVHDLGAGQALKMLEKLPEPHQDHQHVWKEEFPLTRAALWERLILGIMYGNDEKLPAYVGGLLTPLQFSENAIKALRELVNHRLTLDHYKALRLFRAFQAHTGRYQSDAYRALLRAILSRIDVTTLTSIREQLATVKC